MTNIAHFVLPEYAEFNFEYTPDDKLGIMPTSTGANKDADDTLFRVFVFAVASQSSDVHVAGHRGRVDDMDVVINIRTPRGLVNYKYDGISSARLFESKMFALANIAQGGSTPDIVSGRFTMYFPPQWAEKEGLTPMVGRPYAVEVRMEYAKTFDGFSFTCRLIDQQRSPPLEAFGMSCALEQVVKRIIEEPSGLVLVTGPTGSGKTTLLNAVIGYLNNGQNAITTIEDPVEYRLYGHGPIKQIQVHGDITFPRALKSALRQDPDIILIGEIRDPETMEIALQAAQTGHLVLSTLHANNAADTITRVIDLTPDKSRDAMRVGDTLKLVMATRLIDKYEKCPTPRALTKAEKAWMADNGLRVPATIHETSSMDRIGKIPVIEAMEVTYEIRKLIQEEKLDTEKIYQVASRQLHYETLAMGGMRAVESGIAKLKDCQTRLETNRSAKVTPPLRSSLAKEHGLDYCTLSDIIDEFVQTQESNHELTLTDVLEQQKGIFK